tara:strand:- start:1223 stop:1978 length:756 start_codon:yes stop_codon:yes gene_type:complete
MRVLITGASRGIGASIANYFASKSNCQIALLARSLDEPSHSNLKGSLLNVANQVEKKGSTAYPFQCNLKNGKELEDTIQSILKKIGGIDVLVNNASMLMLNQNPSLKERDMVHNINARATMICIDKCLESLQKNNGSIVTISPPINLSNVDWIGNTPSYTISKYSMTLATIGVSNKVRANTVWPKKTIATYATKLLEKKGISKNAFTNGRNPYEFASAVYKVAMQPYTGGMLFDEEVVEMSPSDAPLDLYV